MSLTKNETHSFETNKKNEVKNPADTPKHSKFSEEIYLKKISNSEEDDVFSDLLSKKLKNKLSELKMECEEIANRTKKDVKPQHNLLNMQNKNLNLSYDFQKYDPSKPFFGNDPNSGQKVYLNNLKTYLYKKKAGLLTPRKNKKPERKASRVLSEGTNLRNIKKKNEAELLLDNDAFPSDRILQQDKVQKFIKQQRATHSRVSSAYFIPTENDLENLVEIREKNIQVKNKKKFKMLSPSEFCFDSPSRSEIKLTKKPPKLSRLTWQKNAIAKTPDSDFSFLLTNDKLCPPKPSKWYPCFPEGGLGEIEEMNKENEFFLSEFRNENYEIFGEELPRLRLFPDDNRTLATADKFPDSNANSRSNRLDQLLSSFKVEPLKTESLSQTEDVDKVLNPNVISFEKNVFEDIFGNKRSFSPERKSSGFLEFSSISSKKSKETSNDKIMKENS